MQLHSFLNSKLNVGDVLLLTPAPLTQGKDEVPIEWEAGLNLRGCREVLEKSALPLPGFATHFVLGGIEDKHVNPDRYHFVPFCSGLYMRIEY